MLNKMRLSVRLGLSFAVLLVLMVVIIAVVFFNMNSMQGRLNKIVDENVMKQNLCQSMSENIYIVSNSMQRMLLTTDQAAIQEENKKIEEARSKYDSEWSQLEKIPTNEKGTEIRANIEQAKEVSRPLNQKVTELALAGKNTEAVQVLNKEAGPEVQKWLDALDEGINIQNENNEADAVNAKSAYVTTLVIIFTLGGISVLLGIVIAVFMTRSITKPISQVVEGLTEGAQQVAAASNQLSATSQQLAEGNAEQASSIEETSSTLEESASMIQQNTENTKQATQLAAQTKAAADKGNGDMQEMMSSMNDIKKSSDQIARIIKVIDEIAFQTNILALNAAVEAARAGDAGMGFAVVAEEVRNLAQRSAQAAKDTASIIESNIELSEKGVDVTKKVAESLSEITLQAKKVNELMDEISVASQEQTQGIGQITKAIAQMEKVTQINASNSEESASAAEELSAQAENMKEIVQELISLVNGGSEQKTVRSAQKAYSFKTSKTGGAGNSKGLDAYHVKARDSKPEIHKSEKRSRVADAEEVIPLESDARDF